MRQLASGRAGFRRRGASRSLQLIVKASFGGGQGSPSTREHLMISLSDQAATRASAADATA